MSSDLVATFWRGAKTERRENSSSTPYKGLLWRTRPASHHRFPASSWRAGWERRAALWPRARVRQVALIVFFWSHQGHTQEDFAALGNCLEVRSCCVFQIKTPGLVMKKKTKQRLYCCDTFWGSRNSNEQLNLTHKAIAGNLLQLLNGQKTLISKVKQTKKTCFQFKVQ